MRGLNRVFVSGLVLDKIVFAATSSGTPACGFFVSSTSYRNNRSTSVRVKVNVYGDLVEHCKQNLVARTYAVVEGELMNREGQFGDLTEIRALQILFPKDTEFPEGDTNG